MVKINWIHLAIGFAVVVLCRAGHLLWWEPTFWSLVIAIVHGWTEHYFTKKPFEWIDDVVMFMPASIIDLISRLLRF